MCHCLGICCKDVATRHLFIYKVRNSVCFQCRNWLSFVALMFSFCFYCMKVKLWSCASRNENAGNWLETYKEAYDIVILVSFSLLGLFLPIQAYASSISSKHWVFETTNQLTFRKLQATCEEDMNILDTILGYEEVGKLLEYLRCDASFDLVLICRMTGH